MRQLKIFAGSKRYSEDRRMRSLEEFETSKIKAVFADIDGTITTKGQLSSEAYQALWDLTQAGYLVVPVTGRPAGWCDMIARFWPVFGVIGENGGFYFRYKPDEQKMIRHFVESANQREINRKKLDLIADDVLAQVPGSAISADQFSRLMDLAIDFSEDVPALPQDQILKIQKIFESHGAHAKISSIHVNGWFGDYDKVTMTQVFAEKELHWNLTQLQQQSTFVGDSPNDEPMFSLLPQSCAVANIRKYLPHLNAKPSFISTKSEGEGFVEIAKRLLQRK